MGDWRHTGDTHIITSVLLLNMINTLGPLVVLAALSTTVLAGDINRQSIIFNENTPDVFYCPQEKPISIDRMLVKSKPMKKLCEYEGRGLPENVKSDCWNDVDETEYACSEKKRIMLRMKPPGHENAIIDNCPSTDLGNTRSGRQRIWICQRFFKTSLLQVKIKMKPIQ